jgi:hypothetical protein
LNLLDLGGDLRGLDGRQQLTFANIVAFFYEYPVNHAACFERQFGFVFGGQIASNVDDVVGRFLFYGDQFNGNGFIGFFDLALCSLASAGMKDQGYEGEEK